MRNHKNVNLILLFLSIIGVLVVYFVGQGMLAYLAYLPYAIQCGLYLLIATTVCGGVLILSEIIRSGNYVWHWKEFFPKNCKRAFLIVLPLSFVIGFMTQTLYGFIGKNTLENTTIKVMGTMIICDISGSMNEYDPDGNALESICSYIETVEPGRYVGVILYNHDVNTIFKYAPLLDNQSIEKIKNEIYHIKYDGGTETQTALLEGIRQIREGVSLDIATNEVTAPGIIMLFSDGLSSIDYNIIKEAVQGDSESMEDNIPINTVYYASSAIGGHQMSRIAQISGGTYHYRSQKQGASDIFTQKLALYNIEQIHLLYPSYGHSINSTARIILQIFLLSTWGVCIGILILLLLNHNDLLKRFFIPHIVLSMLTSIIFSVVIEVSNTDVSTFARFLIPLGMCIIVVPTYKWNVGKF